MIVQSAAGTLLLAAGQSDLSVERRVRHRRSEPIGRIQPPSAEDARASIDPFLRAAILESQLGIPPAR